MKINRAWAMSNSHTFSIPPIRELIEQYVGWGYVLFNVHYDKPSFIVKLLCQSTLLEK